MECFKFPFAGKRPDMTVVIGRINGNRLKMKTQGPRWAAVREAQVAVAEADPLATWVDCDAFGDGLHYPPEGYAQMGKRFAEETIALLNRENPPSPDPTPTHTQNQISYQSRAAA